MEITDASELLNIENNKFIGELPELINSKISFIGKNNIFYCEEGVKIKSSKIYFQADNSLIYLRKSNDPYIFDVYVYNNSVVYFGKNNYFNTFEKAKIIISEEKHLFAGNENLFSHGLWFRSADAHLIYDLKTKKRINPSKSIFIGDHCWFGQDIRFFKGAKIHSGTVVGANTIISKKLYSNNIYASYPIKLKRKNIIWDKKLTHYWTDETKQEFLEYKNSVWILKFDKNEYIPFEKIENTLSSLKSAQERLEYLHNFSQNENKNRFVLNKKWFNFK